MKKITIITLFPLIASFILSGVAGASVIQYNQNGYQTPNGWVEIANLMQPNPDPGFSLNHDYYYLWGLNDLSYVPSQVNIVFHGIYDWTVENDWINVYLKDNGSNLGITRFQDYQKLIIPNWAGLGYTNLGVWSDPTGGGAVRYDVVFTIEGSSLLNLLANGNGFIIGIDPDCHYFGEKITIEAPIPVPEPSTLLLLGAGLVGFGIWGRRGIRRNK